MLPEGPGPLQKDGYSMQAIKLHWPIYFGYKTALGDFLVRLGFGPAARRPGAGQTIGPPVALLYQTGIQIHHAMLVSIGKAVVAFIRSIENLDVTFRQARRCVRSR